jgi:hypothetical protein
VLGIAARVFGVDMDPLTKKMDEVSKFMGRSMLEFNDCVSGVQTAAKSASASASEVLSEDGHGAVVAQIEEFRDSPDSEAVSQIILPKVLEGDALDQLLSAVEELDKAMQSNRQFINGLHCYTVRRPTAALPDKVMWLCENHKSLLEQWDDGAITEEQLLERVIDPKAAAAASAATSPSLSLAPRPTLATSTPQPLDASSMSASSCFPSSFPPELKKLSAEAVSLHIKALGKAYEKYSQALVDEGYDGKMIGTFCGRSVDDVLRRLESIGIKLEHRDRILVAFQDLLDPQTYSSQAAGSAQSVPASVRQYSTQHPLIHIVFLTRCVFRHPNCTLR